MGKCSQAFLYKGWWGVLKNEKYTVITIEVHRYYDSEKYTVITIVPDDKNPML